MILAAKLWCVLRFNTPPWVFFTFFKLCKWYQIAQRITILRQSLIQANIFKDTILNQQQYNMVISFEPRFSFTSMLPNILRQFLHNTGEHEKGNYSPEKGKFHIKETFTRFWCPYSSVVHINSVLFKFI